MIKYSQFAFFMHIFGKNREYLKVFSKKLELHISFVSSVDLCLCLSLGPDIGIFDYYVYDNSHTHSKGQFSRPLVLLS